LGITCVRLLISHGVDITFTACCQHVTIVTRVVTVDIHTGNKFLIKVTLYSNSVTYLLSMDGCR